DVGVASRNAVLFEIDDQFQHFRVWFQNAVVVGAVEILHVRPESRWMGGIAVERPQDAALYSGKAELVFRERVQLARFPAGLKVVLVILDHRADYISIRRQLRRFQDAQQQGFLDVGFVFVIG